MDFEIFDKFGRRMFYTNAKACLPDKASIRAMMAAGCVVRLDGKVVKS